MDADDFRREHEGHLDAGCELHMDACPICNIIVHEQSDKFLTGIEEEFHPIIAAAYERWNTLGYCIANATSVDILSSTLAFSAFTRWIRPTYQEVDISDDEILAHPIAEFCRRSK